MSIDKDTVDTLWNAAAQIVTLEKEIQALREENARLILDSDKQIHAAEDRALHYSNLRDKDRADLDAAITLLRELQLPLMPFALLDKIEKFLKELEER